MKGIRPILPGSRWENANDERINGAQRNDVLNVEWFNTTKQAQIVINEWLRQYNHMRPHHALNMRPHVPETDKITTTQTGGRTTAKAWTGSVELQGA